MLKKIICITHEFYPKKGGIAVYIESMMHQAVNIGYNVEIWAPKSIELRIKTWPFTIRELNVKGTQNFIDCLKLFWVMYKEKNNLEKNILFIPEPGPLKTMIYWINLLKWNHPRLILGLHGTEIFKWKKYIFYNFLFYNLLQQSIKISICSNYVQNILKKYFPLISQKIILNIPNLNSSLTSLNEKIFSIIHFNKILFLNYNLIYLLTVGRVHPRKGQLEVIKALGKLPLIKKKYFCYRVVGPIVDKQYFNNLKNSVKSLKINFHWVGKLNNIDLYIIYKKSHIFILTSIQYGHSIEGFGLVYLEASVSGLPVIGYKIGGVQDAIIHKYNGFLINRYHYKKFLAYILFLSNNIGLRKKMSQNGRIYANNFSWKKNIKNLLYEIK